MKFRQVFLYTDSHNQTQLLHCCNTDRIVDALSLHTHKEIIYLLIMILLRKPYQVVQSLPARKFAVLCEESQILFAIIFDEIPCHLYVVLLDEVECVAAVRFAVHSDDREIFASKVIFSGQIITVQNIDGVYDIITAIYPQFHRIDSSFPMKVSQLRTTAEGRRMDRSDGIWNKNRSERFAARKSTPFDALHPMRYHHIAEPDAIFKTIFTYASDTGGYDDLFKRITLVTHSFWQLSNGSGKPQGVQRLTKSESIAAYFGDTVGNIEFLKKTHIYKRLITDSSDVVRDRNVGDKL